MFFKKWIEGFKQTKEQLKLTNHYKKQGMPHDMAVKLAIRSSRVDFLFQKYQKLGFDEDEALKLAEEEFENLPYDQKSL
tara:strand:- start:260 stop:496 length:237 start_codon:yes stop_codon:yes gene_type:complete